METRLATKVFNLVCSVGLDRTPISTLCISFETTCAPHNSDLGIDICLRGATLVLDVKRCTFLAPQGSSDRKLITAAKACSDASANPCSS